MSPRPRKVSDDDIFAAAYRAMNRLHPADLTLAEIAREARVTAGALTQRFGSKRALMLALAEASAASAGVFLRELWQELEFPLQTVRAYAECMAHMAQSPDALARSFAYLQLDLADDDFRAALERQGRTTRVVLQEILDEAVAKGELVPSTDTATLARLLETLLGGSLIAWATYRDGSAEEWILRDVDAVLAPYLAPAPPAPPAPPLHPLQVAPPVEPEGDTDEGRHVRRPRAKRHPKRNRE